MAKKGIWEILRGRYPANEYVLMQEVSDAAGFARSNSADYIIVNLWQSRGLHITGIELKCSRSDWLRELKNPNKAENIFQYCDYFWLLTSEDGIANLEEIPETWGWLNIKGNKIFIKKPAPNLTPIPLNRSFVVAMLKRAADKSNFVHYDLIDTRIEEAKQRGIDEGKRIISNLEYELKELKEIKEKFETASGIDMGYSKWSHPDATKIGNAVKFLEKGGADFLQDKLLNLEYAAKDILSGISKGLQSIKEIKQDEQTAQNTNP